MENAIDHEKKTRIDKALAMENVPLVRLQGLIRARREYALDGMVDEVERTNEMIRELLGV